MNLLDLGIEGIKCDAAGCDYENQFGPWGNTIEEILAMNDLLLDAPCPKCGASLLTEADAKTIAGLVEMAAMFNKLEDDLGECFPEVREAIEAGERMSVRLVMGGSGKVDIKD